MITGPIAICGNDDDVRLAALFFEKVIVAGLWRHDVPPNILAKLKHIISEDELMCELTELTKAQEYGFKRPNDAMLRDVASLDEELVKHVAENPDLHSTQELFRIVKILDFFQKWNNSLIALYQRKCLAASIPAVPFFTDVGTFEGYDQGANQSGAELRITDVPLIEIEKVKWDQIVEVRKDPNFTNALRSFRLLFAQDYRGKELAYVIDSLNQKVARYEESCKKHGLDTALGTARQLLDSKSLLGTLTLATVGILADSTAAITLSAIAGSTIELTKMALYITERKTKFRTEQRNLDIAYLLVLNEKRLTRGKE